MKSKFSETEPKYYSTDCSRITQSPQRRPCPNKTQSGLRKETIHQVNSVILKSYAHTQLHTQLPKTTDVKSQTNPSTTVTTSHFTQLKTEKQHRSNELNRHLQNIQSIQTLQNIVSQEPMELSLKTDHLSVSDRKQVLTNTGKQKQLIAFYLITME